MKLSGLVRRPRLATGLVRGARGLELVLVSSANLSLKARRQTHCEPGVPVWSMRRLAALHLGLFVSAHLPGSSYFPFVALQASQHCTSYL